MPLKRNPSRNPARPRFAGSREYQGRFSSMCIHMNKWWRNLTKGVLAPLKDSAKGEERERRKLEEEDHLNENQFKVVTLLEWPATFGKGLYTPWNFKSQKLLISLMRWHTHVLALMMWHITISHLMPTHQWGGKWSSQTWPFIFLSSQVKLDHFSPLVDLI